MERTCICMLLAALLFGGLVILLTHDKKGIGMMRA